MQTGASESIAVFTEATKEPLITKDEYAVGEEESQSILYVPDNWLRQPQWAL